jgi:hypothetical protein
MSKDGTKRKTLIQGLLTIKEVGRTGKMVLKVQPHIGTNLTEQIVNSSIIMVLPTKNDQVIKFNITNRIKSLGELEIQLFFDDSSKISDSSIGDLLEVIVTQRI